MTPGGLRAETPPVLRPLPFVALCAICALLPLPAAAAERLEEAVVAAHEGAEEAPCDDEDCGCEEGCGPGCCACACCPAPRALQSISRDAAVRRSPASSRVVPSALGAPAPAHAEPPFRPPAG